MNKKSISFDRTKTFLENSKLLFSENLKNLYCVTDSVKIDREFELLILKDE